MSLQDGSLSRRNNFSIPLEIPSGDRPRNDKNRQTACMSSQYKLNPSRWMVLAVFLFINVTIQTLWISYAPVTGPAAQFYGATDLQIGHFAMSFMIAFIPLSIPVSWLDDTCGFRIAVGSGAILMGIFGILRGLAGTNTPFALWSTFGLAATPPCLLNAWTKVPANGFAIEERATAVAIVTLGNLIGTALGMGLTPMRVESMVIPAIQINLGGIAAFSAILFLVFPRETPPTPPCPPGGEVLALMLDGLKHSFTIKPYWVTLLVSFISPGTFNGITTWIENIIRPVDSLRQTRAQSGHG